MKNKNSTKNVRERERELKKFAWEKYAQNMREQKIYSKKMEIRRVKIKEDKWAKLHVKLKPPKMNM